MTGRRLWFVGIGGAGLSAYAQLARAQGAEVGGWDRVRTPYLDALGDVRVEIAPEPVVPEGWEVVVSSAYPQVPGLRRAEFLRELVSGREAIVVAGTHGKGTTAGMIAYVLHEIGRDPAWLIGAPVPQLGSNAGFGDGILVVEGDESDRTVFALPASIAVVTNIELDHHTEYGSLGDLERAFEAWLATADAVVRDAPPYDGALALPGELNRLNAGSALAALAIAGVGARRGCARARALHRHRPALRGARARRPDARRRLRPPPDRGRAHARGRARALPRPDGPRSLPAASLFAHAPPRRRARRCAVRRRRRDCHRHLPGTRAADPRRHRQAGRRCVERPRCTGRLDAVGRGGRRALVAALSVRATCCWWSAPATSTAQSACCAADERRGAGAAGAVHDDRHGRPGTVLREAGDARRAARVAALGEGGGPRGRDDRPRLQLARA